MVAKLLRSPITPPISIIVIPAAHLDITSYSSTTGATASRASSNALMLTDIEDVGAIVQRAWVVVGKISKTA